MNSTVHLGSEFLREVHISNYAAGAKQKIKYMACEDARINVHNDSHHIAALFVTSLIPKWFGKISQGEADKWLRGKISKRETLITVFILIS